MLFALLASLVALAGDDKPKPVAPLAITHVEVVDLTGEGPRRDRTVVIDGGKIVALGPFDEVKVPPGATVVDGSGKFLIPGLWDMHVHYTNSGSAALFVANGVTGVRVMWGNPSFGFPMGNFHFQWRDKVEKGDLLGPRMVVASNIFDGPTPIWPGSLGLANPEAGREAVRKAKADGADFIKVYSRLPRETFLAIAEESKAQGIPFAGHVPSLVSAREASDAGQKTFEHLYGIAADCSTERDALLKERGLLLATGGDPAKLNTALTALNKKARDSFDEATAADLFARFRKNGTWQCPTLTVLRAIASLDEEAFRADPRLKYVDIFTRMRWDPKNDFRLKAMTKEDYAEQKLALVRSLDLVGRMHRAGVKFLAGTDELNPYVFPGFSLHDELALLVKAGLSPTEALRAATINPATFLGKESTMGTVAVGKVADLVLLDADPAADIANTTKIRAVVARGRLLDRDELDKMLKAAEVSTDASKK